MKIVTWNINSIRARLSLFLEFLEHEKPDIVLLQELKCQAEAFPSEEIETLGYNIAINGQKTYNGVAILSKYPLSDIKLNFLGNPVLDEARYIEAIVNLSGKAVRISSVYVPNGQEIHSPKYHLKLEFLNAFVQYCQSFQDEMTIIGGDFNVALTDIDVYDPATLEGSILFSEKERQALRGLVATNMIDAYRINMPDQGFTWWDYRGFSLRKDHGMRIDYLFCSPEAIQMSKQCYVAKEWREKEKSSDHAPVFIVLEV